MAHSGGVEVVAETTVSATANRTDDPASLVGEFFVEAVVHGDQLAVDQQVDVALVGSDAGGGLGDDLGPDQVQADLGGLAADGLAVVGATMVSLAVELGRAGWSGPAWGSSCQCLSRRPGAGRPG